MVIGIDASRAYIAGRTGTENYSYHVITSMLQLPESRAHTFILFIRPNAILPSKLAGYSNVIVKVIPMKYLWTQLGLAWETWRDPKLAVLWVPAHTLPFLRNPMVRTVVTIHGLEYQWLKEYTNLLQRWYLPLSTIYATKSADKLIAVSNFTQKQLVKDLHTSSNKINVIHEGVAIFTPGVKGAHTQGVLFRYGLQDKKYILFVGTIQPRKNLVALIQAFSLFRLTNPDYMLVIAGGSGWLFEEVYQAPAKYQVQEAVVFTGRVSDPELEVLYQEARVYVQPSLTEGFGLPVIEAMKRGTPVICSDGGALPEVVGEAGIVVALGSKPSFAHALAKSMCKITSDPKLTAKYVAKGSKRVLELNWGKTARETLKTLITTGLPTR